MLREMISLKKFAWFIRLCQCHPCGDWFLEYRYMQDWIIAKRKQSPVGWFLESLQQNYSLWLLLLVIEDTKWYYYYNGFQRDQMRLFAWVTWVSCLPKSEDTFSNR